MGLTADQAPAFGHSREVPDGIEGLDVSAACNALVGVRY